MKVVSFFSVSLLSLTFFLFSCGTSGGSGVQYFDVNVLNEASIVPNIYCDVQGIKNANNCSDSMLKDKKTDIEHILLHRLAGTGGIIGKFYVRTWVSSRSHDDMEYVFYENGYYAYESSVGEVTSTGTTSSGEAAYSGTWYIYGKDGGYYYLTLKRSDNIKTYKIQVSDSYLYFSSRTDMSVDGFLDGTNDYITIHYESQYGDCPKHIIVEKNHALEEDDIPTFSEDVLYNQYQLFQGWYTNENVQLNVGMVLNDDIVCIQYGESLRCCKSWILLHT